MSSSAFWLVDERVGLQFCWGSDLNCEEVVDEGGLSKGWKWNVCCNWRSCERPFRCCVTLSTMSGSVRNVLSCCCVRFLNNWDKMVERSTWGGDVGFRSRLQDYLSWHCRRPSGSDPWHHQMTFQKTDDFQDWCDGFGSRSEWFCRHFEWWSRRQSGRLHVFLRRDGFCSWKGCSAPDFCSGGCRNGVSTDCPCRKWKQRLLC